MKKNELIDLIANAFCGVERGEITIHESQVLYDDYAYPDPNFNPEVARPKARLNDTDTHWEEVTKETIEAFNLFLSPLDAGSVRYYLPAYMIQSLHALDNPGHRDTEVADGTIHSLCLKDLFYDTPNEPSEAAKAVRLKKFTLLNEDQSKAVARYLQFMSIDAPKIDPTFDLALDATQALNVYWAKFF